MGPAEQEAVPKGPAEQEAVPKGTAAARFFKRRPPVALALVLGFGSLLLLAVGAVLGVALTTARQNTTALARDLAQQHIDSIVNRVTNNLNRSVVQVQYLADLIKRGELDPADDASTRRQLVAALAGTPNVAGILFIHPDRRAVTALRDEGSFDAGIRNLTDNSRLDRAMEMAEAGPGIPAWSDVFYLPDLGTSVIALRYGIARDGRFLGMIVLLVSIADLSEVIGAPTQLGTTEFILRGKDQVLAHPGLQGGIIGVSAVKPLPGLAEVNDPVMAELWHLQPDQEIAGLDGGTLRGHQIDVQGTSYTVLYREVDHLGASPWIIGSYFRAGTFVDEFRRVQLAAYIGIAIAVAAIILLILLARAIVRPVRRLASAAQAVRTLDLNAAGELPPAFFRELHAANSAFNAMLGALRSFETYVPRQLVLRLIGRRSAGPIQSEERVVSVLFTDIVGFTAIGSRLGPARLADFLNRHFALLARCIEAEGGTLDKYIGDSVMAFWGAPEDQPDHARRAVRAALAMAHAIAKDNRRRRAKGIGPVRVRIGIHGGPVVVGNIGAPGRINYTLIGDTVNAAQRLEALGKAFDDGKSDATILVGAETVALAGPDFHLIDVGDQILRGRDAPIRVYRLEIEPLATEAS